MGSKGNISSIYIQHLRLAVKFKIHEKEDLNKKSVFTPGKPMSQSGRKIV